MKEKEAKADKDRHAIMLNEEFKAGGISNDFTKIKISLKSAREAWIYRPSL